MEEHQSNNTSDTKRIAKNTLYLYGRMLITMVVGLFTARINFHALGIESYGVYNVVGSIIVFFSFINSSLVTATRRYITAEIATGSLESRRNVFNLALAAHGLIAIIVLLLGETVGLYLVNYTLNIPDERMVAANVVYQFTILTAIWQIFQDPYTAVITAYEKMNIYAYLSIVDVIFKLLVAFATYSYPGDKLIAFAFMIFMSGFVNIGLTRLYCIKKFPESRFRRPHNINLLKEMFRFMGWSMSGQLVVVFTNQGVTMLVNVFFSVAANAAMGVSNQITKIVNGFVINFQTAFQPQITKQYVKNEFDEVVNLTIRSSRMSSYLVLFFMVPVFFQIKNFLTIWLGDYPEYAVEFCIYTLIAILIDGLAAPLWMLIYSDKSIKSYQIWSSVIFAFNFILAWIFLKCELPPYSVINARIIVYFVAVAYRLYEVRNKVAIFPIWKWLYQVVIKAVFIISPPSLIMIGLSRIPLHNIYADFLIKSSICAILMVLSIYVIGLTHGEKEFVNNKIKNLIVHSK